MIGKITVDLIDDHFNAGLISTIAGLSHGDGSPSVENLIKWQHESPLEFGDYTFKIKAPITVFRQLMRHRTGKYLERSLRYCETLNEYHLPDSVTNVEAILAMIDACNVAFDNYRKLLQLNVDPEDARGVLPLNTMSVAYVKFDARNLRHFLKLRLDKHAQREIRQVAEKIASLIHPSLIGDLPCQNQEH